MSNDSASLSPLGKATAYRETYAPDLLFPIPRSEKRTELGILDAALPFVGYDLWNAYELSWLNPRGKPVVALAEFQVPATTPRLVESKSLKLYLNSFNQTVVDGLTEVQTRIARDLSAAAGGAVQVQLVDIREASRNFAVPDGICLDDLDVAIDRYSPQPQLLRPDAVQTVADETLYSHLLKSNCLVTGQPDWGMLAVRYSGAAIDREGLLRYLVSFRQHNEFHEQCVERIYTDIQRQCAPARLAVWARYTRRGGLDINPLRASDQDWLAGCNPAAELRQ
ncbi:NADPH-dependent 7-cyano-7-deazaguanine reductase QueF [Viridibacterium curvum]|uniref:NADPH-dependent 7-cyano-7-deazaguanine reductase n=1 Tax=Viridibacterium curvum TaxID=1101404 RepID=A0ABP9Q7Y4_9RHOO